MSVSLPDDVRDSLYTEALAQGRSRSWIVREAVSAYVAARRDAAFADASAHTRQLSVARTPEERVRLCDELSDELAFGMLSVPEEARSFATFDEYHAWRKRRRTVSR